MNIYYLYVSPRKSQENLWRQGRYPDSTFYGQMYLRRSGNKTNYSDAAYSRLNLFHYLFWPLEKILIRATDRGFNLGQALLLWPQYRAADVVIACGDSAALPVLLLKKIGLIKCPAIYISIGLVHKLIKPTCPKWVIGFYSKLFGVAGAIVVFSQIEKNLYQTRFKIKENQVMFIPLGIDTDFFHPRQVPEEKFLLTVGRDLDRDYGFLLSIIPRLPMKTLIVTSKRNLAHLRVPNNTEVLFDIDYEELRDLYERAQLVMIPLKNNPRASGQLVFLESLAMKKAVVASDVPGITSGYKNLSSRAILVPSGNADRFVDAVNKLVASGSRRRALGGIGRKTISNSYTSDIFARHLEELALSLKPTSPNGMVR